ncbi:MAG: TadE/TadG family type IV pilus assembly protein [Amaricoccus sp.]
MRRGFAVLRRLLAPVLSDRRGVAAVFLAVALIPLIGAVGLAIDSSLGYLVKTRMGKSLDTAGLAAGRVALDANAKDVAQQYFDANFGKSNANVKITSFAFKVDASYKFVTLSATADVPTLFMRVFGHDTMNVGAQAVIERETTGMELALVLDNTGSMYGAAFTAMQNAANDLVDILYGSKNTVDNLWVSVVPFVSTVNIGKTRTGWLAAGDRVLTNIASYSTDGWKGCVMGQAMPYDADDTPVTSQKLSSFFYASTSSTSDNNWPPIKTSLADQNKGSSSDENTARGPNLGCGSPITSLTPNKSTVKAALAAMGPVHRGGTTGNLGLTWGWRTISPRWRGLWGGETPNTLPLDYKTPLMEKVAVILTDGNNQFHDNDTSTSNNSVPASDYTAYGRIEALNGNSNGTAQQRRDTGRATLDSRMAATCTAMKAQGIRIYSIIFGAAPDSTAKTLFTNCATTPAMYYYAPNNGTLATAFKSIGGQLANLRIVE